MTQDDLFEKGSIRRSATFVDNLRIKLSRDWGEGPRALVIGCNPSTANADKDDQTSHWWNKWFRQAGFGGYDVANLYPFCTPSPQECRAIVDAAAPETLEAMHYINFPAVVEMAKHAEKIFVCWGKIAWDQEWIAHVCDNLRVGEGGHLRLWCWGTTLSGAPKHPLARGKHRISPEQEALVWG